MPLFSGPVYAARGGDNALLKRYRTLQMVAGRRGVQELPQGTVDEPGFFLKVTDFLSRPNYAVAGVADVLLGTSDRESDKFIIPRIVRELLGFGDKETFGEVLKQAGVAEGGRLSDLVGETIVTRRFDPTVRGTVGLAMDVFLDPLTYLGIGPLGKVHAVSRGGKIALSEVGEAGLNAAIGFRTGTLAKRVGQLRAGTVAEVGSGARRAASDEALRAWRAVDDEWLAAKRLGNKTRIATAEKARLEVYNQIEMEAAELGIRVGRAHESIFRNQALLHEELRRSGDDLITKVLDGKATDRQIRAVLRGAGLNDTAAVGEELAAEIAKLTSPRAVTFWLPGKGRFALPGLTAGKGLHRLIEDITDPATRKAVSLLEHHATTREFLRGVQQSSKAIVDGLDGIFNPVSRQARRLGGFVDELEDTRNGLALGERRIRGAVEDLYAGVKDDPKTSRVVLRYLNGELPRFNAIGQLVHRGMDNGRARQLLDETKSTLGKWDNARIISGDADALGDAPKILRGYDGLNRDDRLLFNQQWEAVTGSPGKPGPKLKIEHRGELRNLNFDGSEMTLSEIDSTLAAINARTGLDITLDTNLRRVTALRGMTTLHVTETERYFNAVKRKFGRKFELEAGAIMAALLPDIKRDLRLVSAVKASINAKEFRVMRDAMGLKSLVDGRPLGGHAEAIMSDLMEMGDDAKAAFLHQMMGEVKDLDHLERLFGRESWEFERLWNSVDSRALDRYRERIKSKWLEGDFAPNGKPWVKFEHNNSVWHLPSEVAAELRKWDSAFLERDEVKGLLRMFDWATNVFKTAVTVPFPAFNFRNWYSNIGQSTLDISLGAMHSRNHYEALQVMLGGTPAGIRLGVPEVTIRTPDGLGYTGAQIRSLAEAHGIKVDFKQLIDIVEGRGDFAFAEGQRLLDKMRDMSLYVGRKSAETIEGEARMLHFIALLRRGESPADAALRVKKYLFDYTNLSEIERRRLRRIFPFYTWQSKNIRLQVRELVKRPGRVAATQKPFRDRGPDNDMLPEYLRGDLTMRLDPGPGKAAAFLSGIDLPQTNLDILFAGSVEKTLRQNIALLNPMLKFPFEFGFGEEAFTGRKIHETRSVGKLGKVIELMGKPAQEFFQYEKFLDSQGRERHVANGTRVYLVFKSWALSRVMGTAAEFAALIDSDDDAVTWWRVLTGLRFNEYDLSDGQRRLLRARYDRLEDQLSRRGLTKDIMISAPRDDLRARRSGATTGGLFGR